MGTARLIESFWTGQKRYRLERWLYAQGHRWARPDQARVGEPVCAAECMARVLSWLDTLDDPYGYLPAGAPVEDLELAAAWPGKPGLLFEGLLACGWVVSRGGHYHWHDYSAVNGRLMRDRLKKRRARGDDQGDVRGDAEGDNPRDDPGDARGDRRGDAPGDGRGDLSGPEVLRSRGPEVLRSKTPPSPRRAGGDALRASETNPRALGTNPRAAARRRASGPPPPGHASWDAYFGSLALVQNCSAEEARERWLAGNGGAA